MQRILALETATQKGSLGLFQITDGRLVSLSQKKWPDKKDDSGTHSEKLPFVIKDALAEANISASDLDILLVDTGPGRWTGVRTGLNVVKTMAFALNKPVYPLNSLQITAEGFDSKPVTVAFQAFKNSIHSGEFFKGRVLSAPQLIPFEAWRQKKMSLCVGDVASFYTLPDHIPFQYAHPSAENMAQVFLKQNQTASLISWRELTPLYFALPLTFPGLCKQQALKPSSTPTGHYKEMEPFKKPWEKTKTSALKTLKMQAGKSISVSK